MTLINSCVAILFRKLQPRGAKFQQLKIDLEETVKLFSQGILFGLSQTKAWLQN